MKTNNKKKIVVSVLALAMGAGLAGSVSGSVAWYQYSTRTSANFVGTSIGTSRNLWIAEEKQSGEYTDGENGDWKQHLTISPKDFKPSSIYITKDNNNKDVINFVDHPVYMSPYLPAAQGTGYKAEFSFVFKCLDTTKDGSSQIAKQVFLTQFNIVNKSAKDLTSAVRVAIQGHDQTFIISKNADTTPTTVTSGNLDLNNNGHPDTDDYKVDDSAGTAIVYRNAKPSGNEDQTGLSYNSVSKTSAMVTTDGDTYNAYSFGNKDGRVMTSTVVGDNAASAPVKVTVWLEGWQPLPTGVGENTSSMWDQAWLTQSFELQFQFACEADR